MPSDSNGTKNDKLPPPEERAAGFSRQFAMAMELPFILVAAIAIGGLIGYFLDGWLHTKPYLMLVFGFLGFFGGLRDMLRRLSRQ
jgi:F0F1-type ATP synthase assembly protein I